MMTIRKTCKHIIILVLFAVFILSIIACCRAINVKAENGTNIVI